MKKILRLFMLAALLLPFSASAYSFMVDELAYRITGDTTVAVTYITYGGASDLENYPNLTEANIPETVTYDGTTYTVTSIDEYSFWECRLRSVSMPATVTSIGEAAFYDCLLESVDIPSSVAVIGRQAFKEYLPLKRVNITDVAAWSNIYFVSDDANPLHYAHHLYLNGEEIKDLEIPSTVTSIGDYAFEGCFDLTSVSIPNSVTAIGNCAFQGCKGMKSASMGNSIATIGSWAFFDCSGLENLTLPNSVTTINVGAFKNCSGMKSVNIPNALTTIEQEVFNGCSSLMSIDIPSSITAIKNYAFYHCRGLTEITFPASVRNIGENVLNGTNIAKITCMSTRPPIAANNSFNGLDYQNCKLFVPAGTSSLYYVATGWNNFDQINELGEVTPITGDVNGDGIVDVSDVNMVIDIILGK